MSDSIPPVLYDGEIATSRPDSTHPVNDTAEDYARALLRDEERYRNGRLHYEKYGAKIHRCFDMASLHELEDNVRKQTVERNKMFLARRIPAKMPEQRPWTLDACQEVVDVWDFSNDSDQTVETIDVVEKLLFDMETGKWEGESNRRFWLSELMRIWMDMALKHFGYTAGAWGAGKVSGYTISIHHNPRIEPQPLPKWMPLSCIKNEGPWQVALEKTARGLQLE